MKLYIAQYFYWEEDHIIGVFSTKDKAEAAINDFIDKNKEKIPEECSIESKNCCSILEYELDIPNTKFREYEDL